MKGIIVQVEKNNQCKKTLSTTIISERLKRKDLLNMLV